MKKLHVYFTLAVVLFLGVSVSANAQGKYGKDSAECVSFLNFYKDYLKQGNLKEATIQWRGALKYCPPTANQNFYIDGRRIYRQLIAKAGSNAELRQGYLDTLMMVNQTRLANFPKRKVAATENIAYDMNQYYSATAPEKVLKSIEDVIALTGSKTKAPLLVSYMDNATEMFKKQALDGEKVLQAYTLYSAYLDEQLKANPADEKIKEARAAFENAFITSGVATCDNLIAVFTPRFEAEPTNVDVVRPIVSLLGADSVCVNSDLFLKAVTALHQIEPSHTSSYFLYKLHASKDNVEEAIKFMEEAIASEESDEMRDGELMFELAAYNFKNGSTAKAVACARTAAEKNPSLAGKANLLVANVWAGQKCTANDMDNRAKYWVAVDYLNKAKAADETLAEEANKLISTYRQYFPKTEDAFMYDLTDGKSYSISCGGLNATTTVRTIK